MNSEVATVNVTMDDNFEDDPMYIPCEKVTDDGYNIRVLTDQYKNNAGRVQALKRHRFGSDPLVVQAYGYGSSENEAKVNSLRVARLNRARTVAKLLYRQCLAADLGHGIDIDPQVQKVIDTLSELDVVVRGS